MKPKRVLELHAYSSILKNNQSKVLINRLHQRLLENDYHPAAEACNLSKETLQAVDQLTFHSNDSSAYFFRIRITAREGLKPDSLKEGIHYYFHQNRVNQHFDTIRRHAMSERAQALRRKIRLTDSLLRESARRPDNISWRDMDTLSLLLSKTLEDSAKITIFDYYAPYISSRERDGRGSRQWIILFISVIGGFFGLQWRNILSKM